MKLIETENSFQLTDFKIVSKHSYKKYSRAEDPATGQRMYAVDGTKLPSVTTILSATKDRSALDNWIKRVGQEEADRIKNEASSIGTEMHTVIENYIAGIGYLNLTDKGEKARKMAHTILKNQSKLSEVWGSEVSLAYEGKYAGATDLIGIWNDKTAILDWKQTNKPKRKEWIEDPTGRLGIHSGAAVGHLQTDPTASCHGPGIGHGSTDRNRDFSALLHGVTSIRDEVQEDLLQ